MDTYLNTEGVPILKTDWELLSAPVTVIETVLLVTERHPRSLWDFMTGRPGRPTKFEYVQGRTRVESIRVRGNLQDFLGKTAKINCRIGPYEFYGLFPSVWVHGSEGPVVCCFDHYTKVG